MAKKKIIELVENELTTFLQQEGYVLYHMEFVKESKDWYLRIFIEKAPEIPGEWPKDVGTDDCEKVSRFISGRLDALDPIEQNYFLEVSSPGMDRPLLKDRDFKRYQGELIDISLYEPVNGVKSITGRLTGHSDGYIDIKDEKGNDLHLPREKVSKVKLSVVF